MVEIDIAELKEILENGEMTYYFKEMKRAQDTSGRKKDVMSYTREKIGLKVVLDAKGEAYLLDPDNSRSHIPKTSKILRANAGSYIIKLPDGIIFINSR